ncbi:tRNA (N6-isopentenyl adenosine(37)-C2)-methylthiotransferase MiaB [Rickettsiales endosymbiont of Stachyamoeba lipophora]|uniref:tRNA (N6-isopentenyl adenosine(37)-C2)-methylthiotransferase MiaB n=1 Tax=Rickettsiales endosymbiont of Stachyamoeba lipophora TaxID=2486578 RepID=UPI000F64FBBF|nr:tRNA (N6-isopentenyl adenosine(37)-C2)-methylthiotransferase MiaB [Rickettsiales endosymbiont of Stachyamoeba lipophora]AZL15564.1 tRNA (N6-isopentenyl adenosine(37)-C2)-methylthiotransferase MiaB [Rickettsiales endosymbiont of Stachyamoeba lipophora]
MNSNQNNLKKLYIKTYGCQMNVEDSHRMTDIMRPHGYQITEEPDHADIVILNTCHIREKATEKVYSELGMIRDFKQQNKPNMVIGVAGCVGQAEGDAIFKRAPYVDIVVGPQAYGNLPDMVHQVVRNGAKHLLSLDFKAEAKFDALPEESMPQGASAFLTVQEGCDKFCTFCVVPYTRGAEFSRPVEHVYREALKLASQGAKEITLLGQNVTAYHGASDQGEQSLAKLITMITKIEGIERIRYTTSHPKDMTNDLIELHGIEPKLMPYLHLPVQSGSDRILKLMNRKHSRDLYLQIIDKFRKARSDMAFSSDFIVGFPGETDQDFEDTMDLIRQVQFTQCYSFKYSTRPGTPAAMQENQIPEEVKSERLRRLQQLLLLQQQEFNNACVGKILPVLLEKKGKYETQAVGKTPYMQPVHVVGGEKLINTLQNIRLTEVTANSLKGELV